jgi:hypothetical protein
MPRSLIVREAVQPIESCRFKGFTRGDNGQLGEASHSSRLFAVHIRRRIKILDSRSDSTRVVVDTFERKRGHPRLPGLQGIPERVHVVSDSRNYANTGYYNPASAVTVRHRINTES